MVESRRSLVPMRRFVRIALRSNGCAPMNSFASTVISACSTFYADPHGVDPAAGAHCFQEFR